MKWMIDSNFFNERIVRQCEAPISKFDNTGYRRVIELQYLLCASVNGQFWKDAEELAPRLNRPIKQCARVWQLCMDEGVLRPVNGGYSATEWLREHGYFNDDWKSRDNRQTQQRQSYPATCHPWQYQTKTKNEF